MLKIISIPMAIAIASGSLSALNVNNLINTDTLNANTIFGGWGHESSFVEKGVLAKSPGHDTVGDDAWQYKTNIPGNLENENNSTFSENFSLNNNESVSFRFSVDMFNSDGTDNVIGTHTDPGNPNDIYFLDIYVHNAVTDSQLAMLRIYTESGSKLNGNHSSAMYGSGWDASAASSYWLMGDATSDSSFYIQFDKDNLFSSYAGGQEGIVPLFELESDLAKNIKSSLTDVDEIKFRIAPNNGWSKEANLILQEVNGQSLTSVNGQIEDTVAPVFNQVSLPNSLEINKETTLNIGAHDLLSDVRYEIEYNDQRSEGLTFTPTKEGADSVTIYALDSAGNESNYLYEFSGINNVQPPKFVSLPTIPSDITYDFFDSIIIDAPVVNDVSGVAKTTLSYGLKNSEEREIVELNSNNQFVINVDKNFAAGDYEFTFIATNAGGETTSEPITATIKLKETKLVDFIDTSETNIVLDYDPRGIRARTNGNYEYFTLGLADLSEKQTITFEVPFNYNGTTNANPIQCFEWQLVNAENPEYSIGYRIWLNQTSANFDAPTNVVVTTPEKLNDITNCGWISYGNNPDYRSVSFVFDPDTSAYFHSYNSSNVLTPALGVDEYLADFFNSAPDSLYEIKVSGFDSSNGGSVLNSPIEYRINNLNGQSFENEDGVMNTYNDPIVHFNGTTECEVNDEIVIDSFIEDYFKTNEEMTIKATVTSPSGSTSDLSIADHEIRYVPTEIGEYTFNLEVVGSSGNTIKKEHKVVVSQEKNPIEITLKGEYETTLNVGDTITILDATYSSHANPEKTKITLIDMEGNEKEVKVGNEVTFDKPGLYTIRYFASDDATPENNTATLDVHINVLDTTIPTLSVDLKESYKLNEEATITITATDDTELTYRTIITSPSNKRKEYTDSVIKETFTEAGEYKINVTVTDLYGNSEDFSGTFTVTGDSNVDEPTKPETPSNDLTLIVSLSVLGGFIVIVGIVVAIVLFRNRKGKK